MTSEDGFFFAVTEISINDNSAKDIDDFIDELLAEDPSLESDLKRERKWVADALYGSENNSLKALRLRAGYSQAQLAKEINMKQPNICEFELGKRQPTLATMKKLATALGVTLDEIAGTIEQSE